MLRGTEIDVAQTTEVQTLALPFMSCVTLLSHKRNLSEPHLKFRDDGPPWPRLLGLF